MTFESNFTIMTKRNIFFINSIDMDNYYHKYISAKILKTAYQLFYLKYISNEEGYEKFQIKI